MTPSKPSLPLPGQHATQRYVDRSALLTSLVVVAVLAGAGYLWYRFALNRNAKTLYAYAEQCAENKDYATAATQFDHYVRMRPTTPRPASVSPRRMTWPIPSSAGQDARSNSTARPWAWLRRRKKQRSTAASVNCLLQTRQFIPAADEAAAILQQDPKNVRAANLRALAFYGQARLGTFKGKPGDVGASLETALSQDPGNRDTAMTLARIYREEPQYLARNGPRPARGRARKGGGPDHRSARRRASRTARRSIWPVINIACSTICRAPTTTCGKHGVSVRRISTSC